MSGLEGLYCMHSVYGTHHQFVAERNGRVGWNGVIWWVDHCDRRWWLEEGGPGWLQHVGWRFVRRQSGLWCTGLSCFSTFDPSTKYTICINQQKGSNNLTTPERLGGT